MVDAVFVSSIGMVVSLGGIIVVGVLGGAILYFCEKVAGKHRTEAH